MSGKLNKPQGILLYYNYTSSPINDLNNLAAFYTSNCSSLALLGRVRLAPQGVNVTIGGDLSALEHHIAAVLREYGDVFRNTDFKLASCDEEIDDGVAKECGFSSLSVRTVKELVTLCSNSIGETPSILSAGKHLTALQFHHVLQTAGKLLKDEASIDFNKVVLLDARNLYETRIGKFEFPDVETMDPATRQYSDLPSWIDSNAEKLRDNCVLMYCTGGIRCEMASAYIRSKGAGFENVFQLYGGIQRYMEQFPDGGFFKGKNFVYDPRISVGSSSDCVIGKCLLCCKTFDDYSSRCRCTFCRMLVLVCNDCQRETTEYVCELCQKYGKVAESVPIFNDEDSEDRTYDTRIAHPSPGTGPLKKLRILCLHGFRQNASSFKGRTASLAKKLKSLAELVFVNAPHELPYIYQPGKILDDVPPPAGTCSKKYAWLVSPEFSEKSTLAWEKIAAPFDPLQYQYQTEGFQDSLSFLKTVFSEKGPFDGILGFSQGAAMTALLCAQRGKHNLGLDFRFVIMCSGFAMNLEGHGEGSFTCPSLHVFGAGERDRQISPICSRDLASYFEDGCRIIIEHDSGHIIPTRPPYIDDVKEFLRRFT